MSTNNFENTDPGAGTLCEGSRSGRCPVAQQHRPGRHPTTAKRKWNKELNVAVMECYFLSNPINENGRPVRGYRQRMHRIWRERGLFQISEQNLCDQARCIRKNEWLSPVEIEMIKRSVSEYEESEENVEEALNVHVENTPNMEVENIVEVASETYGENPAGVFVEASPLRDNEQKEMIQEIIAMMDSKEIAFFPGLKKVDRKKLADITKKVNEVIGDIRTVSITETNDLVYASSVFIARKIGLRSTSSEKREPKEPWWKRRIKTSISEIRKHINVFERKKRGEKLKREKYAELERKYRVKVKGLDVVIEELKQRLLAKNHKLMRYEQRIKQYRINRLFDQDQKKVYQELNGESSPGNDIPDAEESKKFWSDIWSQERTHMKEAEWLNVLREEKDDVQQDVFIISEEVVKEQCKKIPNWKAPGPDGVQGYWLKRLTSLHSRMAAQMNEMVNNGGQVPDWMTKGRTVLCQKDPSKGAEVGNFRPISCLPLMWKLMTGIIADDIYKYLEVNGKLPEEQKGCRRKSRGTKDQLLIDKAILKDCKRRQKNLAMAWVDYKKAYDMVPHSWIIECLKLVNVSDNIISFIQGSMAKWKTELTASGRTLCEVDIKRGIFQGDSLSPLLFVICMIPLSSVLRKMSIGYTLGTAKINNLLFMDDLKLFSKNEKEIDSIVSTVHAISKDICMEFGIQKCGVLVMKRGKLVKSQGIKMSDGSVIKEVEEDGYKYLGIIEADKIKEGEMKEVFKKEYYRRARLVLQSRLNGRNKIKAINTWAVSLMRYGAGVINWRQDELKELDRKTRKLMTMNKGLNPKSDVARLYVKRKEGGRGLISVEGCVKTEENSMAWYIKRSTEGMLEMVRVHGHLPCEEAVDPKVFKRERKDKLKSDWQEKELHGQFTKEKESINWEDSWCWIKKGDLKAPTEALICSAQEQSLRTNYVKYHIDKTVDTPLCRMCGQRGESVNHIISECSKLAQREYKRRHDNVARYVHWMLCGKYKLGRADAWYNHHPDGVSENENFKILWDVNIQCDRIIEARRPDILVLNKTERTAQLIDIAVPGDSRVKEKEGEKVEKYQMLKDEISRLWRLRKVIVIPVVVGALGLISKDFKKHLEKADRSIRIEIIQKTVLLGTARILRKVLSL